MIHRCEHGASVGLCIEGECEHYGADYADACVRVRLKPGRRTERRGHAWRRAKRYELEGRPYLRISEVSFLLGVRDSKLRFWEAALPSRYPPGRSNGSARLYTQRHVAMFAVVRDLRKAGYSLKLIQRLLHGRKAMLLEPEAAE